MVHWAKIGVKCVCIDNSCPSGAVPIEVRPTVGSVYTIAKLYYPDDGGTYLIFHEHRNDVACAVELFRPLILPSQSDDVAMFQRIADEAASQNSIHVSEDA